MSRERIFLAGETGSGKTRALFDIAELVLATTGKHVWYIGCDGGHHRFMPRVDGNERFHLYTATEWMSIRDAYRESRVQWSRGDWLFLDRIDIAWDSVQEYVKASVNQLSEEEMDDFFLQKRIEDKKRKGKDALKDFTMNDFNPLDWSLIRSNYKGVVFNATSENPADSMGLNVVATVLAERTSSLDKADDPRVLPAFGFTMNGEKKTPSYFDTNILMELTPRGYIMHVVKDRERETKAQILVPESGGGLIAAYANHLGRPVEDLL